MTGERGVAWALWGMMGLIFVVAACSAVSPSACEASPFTDAAAKGEATWCAEFWLNRYQTLFAGLLALGGAAATVWAIRLQIDTGKEAEADSRRREHLAAQSVLALALSTLGNYCEECVAYLRKLQRELPKQTPIHAINPAPRLPDKLVEPFMQCVRFTSDDKASQIANLLSVLQIQHARIVSLHNETIIQHSIDSRLLDTADLMARASKLFSYARGETNPFQTERVTNAETLSALIILKAAEEEFPSAFELLRARGKTQ